MSRDFAAVPGAAQPPPFQEAPRCVVCDCSFSTFRRRHHCRCCGRTFCHEHSTYTMPLPQFGLYANVRVCFDCYSKSSRISPGQDQVNNGTSEAVAASADRLSRLDLGSSENLVPASVPEDQIAAPECKCGMPLCICVTTTPEPVPVDTAIPPVHTQPRPKKSAEQQSLASSRKPPSSSTSSSSSSFFGLGQGADGSADNKLVDYDVSGEGLRDAIKNGDSNAVKKLLLQGVDANYCDKQGFTLLHLAALFNKTDIALILIDSGASLEQKNAQGETPLDCAPAMLQYKMRQHRDELAK